MGSTPLGPKSRVWQVHTRDHDLQGDWSALEHPRLARPSHLHMLRHTCLAPAYRQFLTTNTSHGNWVVTSWASFFLPSTTGPRHVCAYANVTHATHRYSTILSQPRTGHTHSTLYILTQSAHTTWDVHVRVRFL